MKLINVGYENSINCEDIVTVSNSNSQPAKRTIKSAKGVEMLIDLTEGNKTGSMVVMKSGHVILSIHKPETLKKRCNE